MQTVNDLIRAKLSEYPPVVGRICEEIIKSAALLPERAVEDRLEELVRKAVKRGEDTK